MSSLDQRDSTNGPAAPPAPVPRYCTWPHCDCGRVNFFTAAGCKVAQQRGTVIVVKRGKRQHG